MHEGRDRRPPNDPPAIINQRIEHIIKLDPALLALGQRLVAVLEAERVTPEDADLMRSIRTQAQEMAARLKAVAAKTPNS